MLLYAENSEDPKLDQLPVPASQSKASIKAETAAEKVRPCVVSQASMPPERIQTITCGSYEQVTDLDARESRPSVTKC